MKKDSVKEVLKIVIPALLAVGATLGYVDQACVCAPPDEVIENATE